MDKCSKWLNDPEYIKLAEFLVEKTKAKEILTIKGLAIEFKENNKLELHVICLESRIKRFRRNIHIIPHLDTETKVKLLFGLSVAVDSEFLKKLRNDAEVEVDDYNRIAHFKKNDGSLELMRKPVIAAKYVEKVPVKYVEVKYHNDQMLEFLAEKVEKQTKIISVKELCKEFRSLTGGSQQMKSLEKRFRKSRAKIYESDGFDEDMKVRMLFASGAVIPDYVLAELRKTATVVVDEKNKIIEYQKKDGSLTLKREPEKGKRPVVVKAEVSQDSNDSEEEEENEKVKTRSGRVSKTNFSEGFFYEIKKEVGSSGQRNNNKSMTSNVNTPISSSKKRKLLDYMTRSVEEKKPVIKREPEEEYDNDYCFDDSYQYDDEQRVKLELFDGPLKMDMTRGAVIDDGDDFVEEIPAPTEHFVAPKQEELWMDIKMEEPDYIDIDMGSEIHQNPSEDVGILQNTITDVPEDSKELTLILGALNDFIDILNMPSLSDVQKKIETKLKTCKDRKEIISNNEINLSLELCFAKVTKIHQSSENNESMSLKEFLCYLNYSVKTMKCPYLVGFQEKLKKTIDELRVQDKTVPLTTIRGALENTIDNLITC